MAVETVLEKEGLHPVTIDLGVAEIQEQLTKEQANRLNTALKHLGFELADNRKTALVEKIKNLLVEHIYQDGEPGNINLSAFLPQHLHHDYSYLSNLFSELEGTTIEKYFISLKIEKVKELLVYDEFSLSEIAEKLGYSSVAHLSGQFKKVTGLTPSFYKTLKQSRRRNIDEL
ncbi:MAG TPA: AraC family transcriptional regulator [Chitinophagaceae bacterium]|nr:AraC family transcriptional regulator [Chitinophagaceae bacterium]